MNHPLRNFQRGPTWSSNNDPLVASNRIMDDLQFLPGIRMKSIVDRDSGTIGILECCSTTIELRHESQGICPNPVSGYYGTHRGSCPPRHNRQPSWIPESRPLVSFSGSCNVSNIP